jgi:hypothetical protein
MNVDCPNCGNQLVVPAPVPEVPSKAPFPTRIVIATAVATAVVTSGFWWATPFIARAKGKQAAKGALSELQEQFQFGGDPESKRKHSKLEETLKEKVSLQFDGNQRVTVTNNSDFEIESIAFEYLNDDGLRVASGHLKFRVALKSGQTVTEEISSHETVKAGFKVRPWYAQFTSQADLVSFPK